MKKASQFFSREERKAIENAVARAEQKTSGEIVPVVATVSGRYDRGEDIFGLITAVTLLCAVWIFFQGVHPGGDWADGKTLAIGLLPIVAIVIGGFMLGAVIATYIPALRLPFIAKSEMKDEVERRAAEAFQNFRVRGTRGATGILIYVSLYERSIRILGDDAISKLLTRDDWNEVRDLIAKGLKENRAAEGFCAAITKCGDLLANHFPIKPGESNELSNELRFID